MASQKFLVAFLLIAAFALPAIASLEKDVIAATALEAFLNRKAPLSNNMMKNDAIVNVITNLKTVISNPVIEEALLKTNHGVNGIPGGESCVFIPYTITALLGCSCSSKVCYKNSLAYYFFTMIRSMWSTIGF